jgi:hypothetical protein
MTWIYVAAAAGGTCCLMALIGLAVFLVCRRKPNNDDQNNNVDNISAYNYNNITSATITAPTTTDSNYQSVSAAQRSDVYNVGEFELSSQHHDNDNDDEPFVSARAANTNEYQEFLQVSPVDSSLGYVEL